MRDNKKPVPIFKNQGTGLFLHFYKLDLKEEAYLFCETL
jgi:hypothetical protein